MSRLIPIVSVFLLFFIIIGGYLLWWPRYQDLRNVKLELGKKEKLFKEAEEHLSGLNAISNELEGYKEELAQIDSAFPTESSPPALFNFIRRTSAQNGLILKSMNLQLASGQSKEKIQKISFSVSVTGSYSSFKNFLSSIYKNTRLIEVNSISFSSAGEKEGESNLFTFSMALETQIYNPSVQEQQPVVE